ncbi:inositol 1,4,5-triphosphate receptor associated 1 isoform X8 [Panthera uncia]|uniref:inositol 1,4,5-triphosphate receptor associated 1 isoform X10 n=1 Tax=Panthera leo TaxID=9689 RepID=UPI00042BED27|nr:inositol 1,4,5-triphosphate receptor associated 1 isoform X10 [Panthera leo]XP_049506048.1 inositol 1,4,5-triphosphate receptor associated 1 isoform X8 [Panthera uncia]
MGVDLTCPFGVSSACGAQASWSIFGADAAEVPGTRGHSCQEAAMPHIPEDEEPPGEPQAAQSPAGQGPHTAEISCSPPTIILTGEASSPEGETDKNLVNRAHSPHRRLSHRNLKVSTVSLTSVDPAGHIIDLVHDQLPDISISEEDKKKNLALLEEAKLVSERFLTRRGRKSKSCPGDSQSAVALNLSPGASPASSQSNSLTVPTPPGLDACSGPESSLLGAPPQKGDEAEVSSPHLGEPEHILMRNQNLVGLKLPDLSEAAEQEKGLPSEHSSGIEEDESKSGLDVMPNISDMLLRKLRVHRSLPGSAPPLTEKEVENVFVQLSLAFRNDSYTLESRINQAERERNLTEENTEKELENFKASITSSASLWHHCEHRETYQKLLEDIAVLHRLAARLSSRAEMVGAVRQEKRMSKATEVMMQYVENLKRTYEKDHAELMEFKKLANQNSSRSCGPSEDGVPRTARSMSLTLGKNMPRRRVSVAVVPKFNALNMPGQSSSSSPIPSLPALSESPNGKGNLPATSALPALLENGKTNADPDCEASAPMPTLSCVEISQETTARMEEEAYNKGYQEGLKKTKELQDLKEEEEEQKGESLEEAEEAEETEEEEKNQRSSKLEELVHFLQVMYPKLCQHWQVIWMMATVMLVLTVVLGLYSSYNSCVEQADGPHGRSTCSAAQRDSWWSSGLQHEQPAEQ